MVQPNETPRPDERPRQEGLSLPQDLSGHFPNQQQLHRQTFSIALSELKEQGKDSLNLQARFLMREQKDAATQFTREALEQLQPSLSEKQLDDIEFALKTAIDEIFNNQLDHDILGYSDGERKEASEEEIDQRIRENSGLSLRVDVEISPDSLSLRSHLHSPFEDFDVRWAKVDPEREISEAELLESFEKDHGRGLALIRGTFPLAEYDRASNVITFSKPLNPEAKAA